jgi:NitT/TauT family transport system substrate-binding protein
MKKIFALTLVLALLLLSLAGCARDNTAVRLGGMTGPTSIGMAKLLADDKAGVSKNDYEFVRVGSGPEMKAKLLAGDVDIAAIPANLAATLYNATNGEIQVIAINTLGVVSLLEKGNTVNSLTDLAGKTVYAPASAKGAIPELVFAYLLSTVGLSLDADVTVEWLPTGEGGANPLGPKLKNGEIVLSPEPAATALLSNVEGARRAIVLDDAWDALENGSDYITGVTVVRRAFAEEHPQVVRRFLDEYEDSIEYANENVAATAKTVVEFEILTLKETLIEKAIPSCNIEFEDGEDMKEELQAYFALLVPVKPAAFGGKAPDDGFYYVK